MMMMSLYAFLWGCRTDKTSITCGEGTHLFENECLPDVVESDTNDHEVVDTATVDTGVGSDTGTMVDTGNVDEDTAVPDVPHSKSPKRGLAYNLTDTADVEALADGVSWWYNWYFQSELNANVQSQYNMEFVPMLWGYNSESDYIALENWLLANPSVEHVLVMNEPNLTDQANMTPTQAVTYWQRYETFQAEMLSEHNRVIKLVGPAMTWGTMPNYGDPVVWLDAFYAAFNAAVGRDPIIDVLAFHWYDYGLDEQLTRLEKYGKPFWVTEMANWHSAWDWTIDTPEKQMQTMIDMVNICESRDDVQRYAWFIGRWDPDPHYTSIFTANSGELTALGAAYLEQPWSGQQ